MTPEAPQRIGQYEVLDTIGRGGMASVYRAYQPSLDRLVAIKVIAASLASEPEFMDRFRQEALTAARLRHSNVVVVHDFGEQDGVPYLVMEYVTGRSLAELLDDGVPMDRAVDYIAQVAAGLDYAHQRGVVHRDVKPGNVLVDDEGRVVLVDFGLARMMESAQHLTLAGGVVGTPEYMSPEQASGRTTDHRTDVYSLGIVAFELLTGTKPFSAETPLGVLLKHVQEPVPTLRLPNLQVALALDGALKKALAKDPDERYQSAGAFARALQNALTSAGGPGAPLPPPMVERDLNAARHVPMPAPEPPSRLYIPPQIAQQIAQAQTPPEATPPAPEPPPVEAPPIRTCPSCGTHVPPEASFCPHCFYLMPFETDSRPEPVVERLELVVSLQRYGLRWDGEGLQRARDQVRLAITSYLDAGWQLVTPLDAPGVLAQAPSARGPVVSSARVLIQRVA
jgi:eukaryotic-like serine/threonine-protein kinase